MTCHLEPIRPVCIFVGFDHDLELICPCVSARRTLWAVGTLTTLDRPVYGVCQAAELLGLRHDRVEGWLNGYERRDVVYPPVIREVQEEAGLDRLLAIVIRSGQRLILAFLSETYELPMEDIRAAIAYVRSPSSGSSR